MEKAVKGKEEISGDNFSLHHCREGRFIGALSDGMGSGMAAYRDSEMVIDLLEQFLEAGFSKETAVRMINSALIVRSDAQVFSTIDISSLDLYTGVCEFLKVGASTTFIRRENWVEVISSTSLPAGVFHKLEPDCSGKKLYDGDMVIMVTARGHERPSGGPSGENDEGYHSGARHGESIGAGGLHPEPGAPVQRKGTGGRYDGAGHGTGQILRNPVY